VLLFLLSFVAVWCVCECALTFVSGYDSNVTSWNLDESGALTYIASSNGMTNPSWMAWSSNREHMYAVNEIDNPPGGGVVAFSVDYSVAQLKVINSVPSGGGDPCFISVHRSDKWAFVANYQDGYISIFPLNQASGAVGAATYNKKHGELAHMMITDSSGKFVFSPFKGSDYIAQFVFDENSGALIPNPVAAVVRVGAGVGPRHLVFHPSERFAFAVTELASTVITFTYDRASGTLTPIATVSSLPPNYNETSFAAEILVSANGRFVYASNRGHNSIAIFRVDESTGLLTAVGWELGGGVLITPRGVAFDSRTNNLLVAAQGGNTVTTFSVNHETGALTKVMTVPVATQPSWVGVIAFGDH